MFDGTEPGNEGISSLEGLHRLRTILSAPGRSVRLAGLSGVGKTRFVQALFDDRVGEQALDKSEAFYADVAEGPDPDPNALIEQLTVQQSRSIIILDNCPPILHRQATNICTQASSTVSLVTVEYDVRDDLPPETSVFRLEPASDDLIKKLIESHCPHVSQVDARTIAEVSGGNANIAIALANTVSSGETLSGLRDDELFRRLFTQRKESSDDFMRSAEAISLVYWAGRYRSIRIAKNGNAFCFPEYIDGEMRKLFDKLKNANFYKELTREQFSKSAANFTAELNAIHPFREGNGRTQTSFLAVLADAARHSIDLTLVRRETFLPAMISSFSGKIDPLEAEIRAMLV